MTSFKFPPPPPPPPKASPANDSQNTYSSQRGGRGHGRGERGRGRGAVPGRGHFQGNARGGHGLRDGLGSAYPRGGPRGGSQLQHAGRGGWQNYGNASASSSHQFQQPALQGSPTSQIYINPTLSSPALNGTQVPQADPNTLLQAMSFMATPAGMQSMAAFANHMATVNANSPPSQPHASPSAYSQPQNSSPPTGINKRKRQERQTQYEAQQRAQGATYTQQPGKKPPRAKCKAPPEVPGFGFTLPKAPVSRPSPSKPTPETQQQKPRVNMGLINSEDTHQSSDEEDVDEEAALSAKYKVEGVMFEHNGESISLQTPAEVAAWIRDRRRQFPTQKRILQKADEAAARRVGELEFLRKIKGKSGVRREGGQEAPEANATEKEKSKRTRKPLVRSRPNLDVSGQLQGRTATKDAPFEAEVKPEALDLGLGYASDTASDRNNSSELSDSSVVSSSTDSSEESDNDSDADDSEAPPETKSVKVPVAPVVVPPPPRVMQQPKQKKVEVCPYWAKHGTCKYGSRCKNPHPEKSVANPMGLYERMVQQELEKADRLALDAIKYLGRNGFLG